MPLSNTQIIVEELKPIKYDLKRCRNSRKLCEIIDYLIDILELYEDEIKDSKIFKNISQISKCMDMFKKRQRGFAETKSKLIELIDMCQQGNG